MFKNAIIYIKNNIKDHILYYVKYLLIKFIFDHQNKQKALKLKIYT